MILTYSTNICLANYIFYNLNFANFVFANFVYANFVNTDLVLANIVLANCDIFTPFHSMICATNCLLLNANLCLYY